MKQIECIKHKLQILQVDDWRCYKKVFRVESHQFKLNSPLHPLEIADFEARYGIVLPSGYVEFLTQIGNGGAGPGYGMYPLHQWYEHAPANPSQLPPNYLSNPSPLREDVPLNDIGWEVQLGTTWEERYQGAIAVTELGCAITHILIVSGELYGRVVLADPDEWRPGFPPERDFLSWYEAWLDKTTASREEI